MEGSLASAFAWDSPQCRGGQSSRRCRRRASGEVFSLQAACRGCGAGEKGEEEGEIDKEEAKEGRKKEEKKKGYRKKGEDKKKKPQEEAKGEKKEEQKEKIMNKNNGETAEEKEERRRRNCLESSPHSEHHFKHLRSSFVNWTYPS